LNINETLTYLGINVFYLPLVDSYGKYDPVNKLIFINENLPEQVKYKALCHELGHALNHHQKIHKQACSFVLNSKNEYEAEKYSVHQAVFHWLDENDTCKEAVNAHLIMKQTDIATKFEYLVKEEIIDWYDLHQEAV
jgi:hypothetical protein